MWRTCSRCSKVTWVGKVDTKHRQKTSSLSFLWYIDITTRPKGRDWLFFLTESETFHWYLYWKWCHHSVHLLIFCECYVTYALQCKHYPDQPSLYVGYYVGLDVYRMRVLSLLFSHYRQCFHNRCSKIKTTIITLTVVVW